MVDVEVEQATSRARTWWATGAVAVATVGALLALLVGVVEAFSLSSYNGTWVVRVPVGWPAVDLPDWVWGPSATGWAVLQSDGTGLNLWVEQADRWTTLLAEAAQWIVWPVVGLSVLLLVPVLRSLVAGRVFAPGNAKQVFTVAAVVAAGWAGAAWLPYLAAARALAQDSTGVLAGALAPAFRPEWWPLGVVALLVLLALAIRQGTSATRDTEGLV